MIVQAWAWQQHLLGGLLEDTSKDVLGSVILLQHPPILTLGAGSTEDNLLFNPQDPPLPLFRTERGGEATYHGPGQLVVYPIFNLQRLRPDLHWYLRSLEEVLIRQGCLLYLLSVVKPSSIASSQPVCQEGLLTMVHGNPQPWVILVCRFSGLSLIMK